MGDDWYGFNYFDFVCMTTELCHFNPSVNVNTTTYKDAKVQSNYVLVAYYNQYQLVLAVDDFSNWHQSRKVASNLRADG